MGVGTPKAHKCVVMRQVVSNFGNAQPGLVSFSRGSSAGIDGKGKEGVSATIR